MKKELICISCPRGCHITAAADGDSWLIEGNMCPRGKKYAADELTDPKRTITCVMKTDDPGMPYISVRTTAPCPKNDIPSILNRLYSLTVKTPVKNGDIIIEKIDNSEIGVIVTENI